MAPYTLQIRRIHGHPIVGHPHKEAGHRTSVPEEASEPRQSKSVTQAETVKERSPLLPQITEKNINKMVIIITIDLIESFRP
jgi:hypothetical protein